MNRKVLITVPEDIYAKLSLASNESMRPIATEALFRMSLGLQKTLEAEKYLDKGKFSPPKGAVSKLAKELPKSPLKDVDLGERDDKWAIEIIGKAKVRGDREYWAFVKGELLKGGYSFDITSGRLVKGDKLVKQIL